jgi:hypothetical protein
MLKIPDAINLASGKKYYTCRQCGSAYDEVDIPYKLGTATPTVGQTITGATSGATAVVNNIKLVSGAWSGTATGTIRGTSPSAFDFDTGHWGTENEVVTSSTGSFTLDGYGHKKSYGRYYPEDEIVERDGTYLCLAHNSARWNFKDKNEQNIEIDEGDRE